MIKLNDIFDFYELRIKCHVASVNYFAGLLGYHFPEHDSDKVIEPLRTGYAYIFYKTYHQNFHLTQQQIELCQDAKSTHHTHALHHIEHYKDVNEIPDIYLYEIVSDWASANFEQENILCDKMSVSLEHWFDKNMSDLSWTPHQLEIIKNAFNVLAKKTDAGTVRIIWQPLLEKSDL